MPSLAPREILDQIVDVLEPGREPDKPVTDSEFGARLRRQSLMRGGRGWVTRLLASPRLFEIHLPISMR